MTFLFYCRLTFALLTIPLNMKYIFFFVVMTLLCAQNEISAQIIELPVFEHPTRHELDLEGKDEIVIRLKGLSPGEKYTVYLPQDHSSPILSTGNLPQGVISHDARMLSGIATDGYVEFCLNVAIKSIPTFRIFVEKGERYQAGGALKVVGDTIETEGSLDLEFMLNTIFRKDSCFELTPTNIISVQRPVIGGDTLHQTGVFRNGVPTVGIDSGLIVSTGWVESAAGPNFFASSQSGLIDIFDMNGVDPDAASLVPPGIDVYDIAVLEFEFIPTTDTISFNYVFFSEQYCASGAGVTNDAFGFLLTGPDGLTRNIARLPVSDDVVSPATLNPQSPDAAFFLNNTTAAFDDPCVDTPPPPERLRGIAYDGFSTVLQAKGAVVPCAPHTLKIIVVDAGDFILDSGILLEAGSFLAGLVNKPEPNTTAQVDILRPVEGCDTATIRFTRRTLDEPFINMPLPVKYNIIPYFGAETEAVRTLDAGNTAGADYILPESPFVIPAGDTSAVLNIPILSDGDFGEGLEAFVIRYDGTCDCTENADTFWIQDNVPFDVELGPDITSCAGVEINLTATPLGGNGIYTYSWPDPALTGQTITYTATGRDTSIIVNVMDGCSLFGADTIFIGAPAISAVTADAFYSLCSSPTASVFIDMEGSSLYDLTIEIDSSGQRDTIVYQVSGDTTLLYDFSADVTIIGVTDVSGCGGAAIGTANIRGPEVALTASVIPATCGQAIGAIDLTTLTGNSNYTFEWLDDPTETTASRTVLPPGTYTVVIAPLVDATCTDTLMYELAMPPVVQIDSFEFSAPACAGETVVLAPVVSGGTPPYTLSWPDSTSTDSLLTIVTQTGRTIYPFEVTDSCGFIDRDTVVFDLPDFSVELDGRFSLCNQAVVNVPLFVNGPVDNYTISLNIDSAGTQVQRVVTTSGGGVIIPIDFAASLTVTSITNAAGCPGDVIVGFATVVDPMISFNPIVENIRCEGELTGSIALINASPVPVNYTWGDVSDNTGVRTGLAPGTYNLTISDAVDPTCFRDTSFVLTEPLPFSVALSLGSATCPFTNDTLAPVITGGTPPYVFNWPDSMVTDSLLPIVTQAGTNTYVVNVTDDCGVQTSAFVTYTFEDVQAGISGTYGVCNAPFNVDVPLTLTGSSSYTVVIRENMVERTLNLTGSTFINYTEATTIELISITGADGCFGAITDSTAMAVVVDVDFDVTAATSNVSCEGGSDGSINLDVNGDPAAYTYNWLPATISGPNPTGLPAGIYRVRITDTTPIACFFDTLFTISEPAALTLSVSNSPVSCQGETVTLSPTLSGGTGPYNYDWDNGLGNDSLYMITTTGGMTAYPLAVTDACGQTLRDTVFLNFSDTRAEVSGSYSVCNAPFNVDVPITLTGIGPFTFVVRENGVDRSLTASADTLINYAIATTVQLISVTGGDNCPGTAGGIATVTDGTFNLAVDQTNVLCNGAMTGSINLVVNGDNSIYDFTWTQPGLTGPNVSNLAAGTYNLRITDQTPSACTFDTTFNIIQPAAGISMVTDSVRDETCRALGFASANYSGGTGQLTYRWSNGTTGNVLGEVPSGLYTLSVTDENNCEVTQAFNLQDRSTTVQAAISASAPELSCTQLSLDLSAAQATQVVEYLWSNSNGDQLGSTRGITVTSPGRYFVLITNPNNGCSAIDSINVSQSDDVLNLELPVTYALDCKNNTVDLTVSHPDFTGTVSYEWTFNGGVVGTNATLANVSATGTYEVEATRMDNGCQSIARTEVIIDRTPPNVNVPERTVTSNCRDPEVTIGVTVTGPNTFLWSTTTGNLTGATDEAFATADRAGTYSVIVTDTTNGCTTTEVVTVILDGETLDANAGTDQTLVCTGLGTVLNGSFSPDLGRTEMIWFDPSGNEIGEGTQVFTTVPGPHVLEVIHPVSGCSSFDTVMVIDNGPTDVTYTLQQPPCPEVGGRLFVNTVTGLNGPFDYSSPTGMTEPFGTGLRGLRVGTNVLVVTDQLGCELRDTFQIFDGEGFTGNAPDVTINLGDEGTLGVSTNRTDGQLVSWEWGNLNDSLACLTCPDPSTSPLESFIATVTIIDTNGCELLLRQNVIVDEGDLIYMPTAFSPANRDGVNDVYTVFGNPDFVNGINYLHIFDRWGNRVFGNENFSVNDPDAGWDGTANDGRLSPSAVYAYVVSYQRFDNVTEVRTGGFTLVR